MHARTRLAAFRVVIAAGAIAAPVASASTATTPAAPRQIPTPVAPTPACPIGYVKNLATGCAPYWLILHGTLTNRSGS